MQTEVVFSIGVKLGPGITVSIGYWRKPTGVGRGSNYLDRPLRAGKGLGIGRGKEMTRKKNLSGQQSR